MTEYNINKNKLYRFQWDMIDSNMYIIIKNNRALVIDPVCTPEACEFILKAAPTDITALPTHEHFDHINGINFLKEHFNTKVCCIRSCAERICSQKTNLSDKSEVIAMFNPAIEKKNIHIEPFECKADVILDNSSSFQWENININIEHTPGHSLGSACIFLDEKYAFTGDTLLEYKTITRLPGGNKEDYCKFTIPLLKKRLNSDFIIFPGHGNSFQYGGI